MKTNVLVAVALGAYLVSPGAEAETDACGLLTTAQVSSNVGFPVSAGQHVTPTFLKTCTWSGTSGGGVQAVTLNLQTGAFFDGAKKQANMAVAAGATVKSAGVGDDSYFLVEGTQVMLWVKKGAASFKVAIYKQIPVAQKEAMELTLARQVAQKL